VCKLYSWGFPAYFDPKLLEPLESGGTGRLNDWRNFYYPTDPIGGSVAPDLAPAEGDPVDEEFLDPAECYYVYGQAPPAPQKHSGYWADPRVWSQINHVAAGLAGGPPPPPRKLIRKLVQAPEADAAKLAQLAAELPVKLDRGGEVVEVRAAEGAIAVDGDDGQVAD
jgi:hypothetical protein